MKRRAESSNPLAGLPVWARAIAWVGLPAAIGGYLVWMLAGAFTAKLEKIDDRVAANTQDMAVLTKHLADDNERAWAVLGVMSRICINTSKTDDDRLACVAVIGSLKSGK